MDSVPARDVSGVQLLIIHVARRCPPAIKTIKMNTHHDPDNHAFAYKTGNETSPVQHTGSCVLILYDKSMLGI